VSQENVEVVRDHYAAANERDFARAMSHYAEDVELFVPSGASVIAGTFTGRDSVGRWFGDWFATFDTDARFDIEDVIDIDDTSVLFLAKHHVRGRASGVEVDGDVIWLYRLRDGKIVQVRGFESRSEALKAVGLED
jgi:ketosteroid isomerase-like protein